MFTSMESLWKRAVDFHGHACPGLAIGCRMAAEAAEHLGLASPSSDEEIVCVSETDACCVDAVQAVLGCTLGKGNLLLRPRGKAAMSVYNRESGKGCRVLWLGAGDPNLGREEKIRLVLSPEGKGLVRVTPLATPPPERALLSRSLPCANCGERASEAMLRPYEGKLYCLDCWPDHNRILP
jgi:formylmethanofuran dehydrogenase subunit E